MISISDELMIKLMDLLIDNIASCQINFKVENCDDDCVLKKGCALHIMLTELRNKKLCKK